MIANLILAASVIPFIYYLIAIYSAWRYFRLHRLKPVPQPDPAFTPPVSVLKPIRGLDPDAYENLASFCRYPHLGHTINDDELEAVRAMMALRL
jgi:ceramide glucosyltransferase